MPHELDGVGASQEIAAHHSSSDANSHRIDLDVPIGWPRSSIHDTARHHPGFEVEHTLAKLRTQVNDDRGDRGWPPKPETPLEPKHRTV